MKFADKLGIISLIVSLFLGLPPLVALFKGESGGVFALFIIFSVIFLLLGIFLLWLFSLPPWTIILHKLGLGIKDPRGQLAILRKELTLRSNSLSSSQRYTHRRISSDGSVTINNDPSTTMVRQVKQLHDIDVELDLNTPVPFLGKHTHWIEFVYQDSFPGTSEAMFCEIESPTHELSVTIEFPDTRLPKNPRVNFQGAGKSMALHKPTAINNVLSWNLKKGRFRTIPRGRYEVWWEW